MPIVVDVNNVLHVTGVLPPDIAGPDEGGLALLIGQSRFQREGACLVCDGAPRGRPTHAIGSVVFHYAGPRSSADAQIARIVTASTHPRTLTVVSSDRAIIKHARRRRCPTLSASEFLQILATDHAARSASKGRAAHGSQGVQRDRIAPLSEEQVRAWIVYFGLDDPARVDSLKRSAREGPAHLKPHDRRTPRPLQ